MGRNQKILVTTLWAVAVLAMIGVVGTGLWARRQGAAADVDGASAAAVARVQVDQAPAELEPLYDAPSFSLTDQNGRTVTNKTLHGDVWVAMVFFTNCPGVCPMMVSRMTELQKAVTSPDAKVVAFSVDPERDTPEVMKAYAERVGADPARWYFLTGPKPTMFEVAHALKLAAEPAQDNKPLTHTNKALLIDRAGHVRGVYDATDPESMAKLAKDARTLLSEKGKPA
jgi:protein SCO1/2